MEPFYRKPTYLTFDCCCGGKQICFTNALIGTAESFSGENLDDAGLPVVGVSRFDGECGLRFSGPVTGLLVVRLKDFSQLSGADTVRGLVEALLRNLFVNLCSGPLEAWRWEPVTMAEGPRALSGWSSRPPQLARCALNRRFTIEAGLWLESE